MTTLYILLTAVLALAGAVMQGMTMLYRAPAGQKMHLREGKSRPVTEARFRRYALINSVLSVVLVYGLTYALQGLLFHTGPVGVLRVILEGVAILLVYDLSYYALHRYPLHEWNLLRRVHAVHHTIRNPTALDSLYQHPVENFLGLTLLWLSALIVALVAGRISIYSFGWAFCVYSLLNVVIHSGLEFKTFPLTIVTYLGRRHYKHHMGMRAKNYASITPIFDLLFRTEET